MSLSFLEQTMWETKWLLAITMEAAISLVPHLFIRALCSHTALHMPTVQCVQSEAAFHQVGFLLKACMVLYLITLSTAPHGSLQSLSQRRECRDRALFSVSLIPQQMVFLSPYTQTTNLWGHFKSQRVHKVSQTKTDCQIPQLPLDSIQYYMVQNLIPHLN